MSVTNPADEYEALVHVLVRVSRRFPSVPEDTFVELIAGEVSRFGRVRLRNYVPVLVEANVVRTLRGTGRLERRTPPPRLTGSRPHD